jgi:hypothetical protein
MTAWPLLRTAVIGSDRTTLRKAVLLASARITPVWDAYFPLHRMDDWRLRRDDYDTGAFEREAERIATVNKKRKAPKLQRLRRLLEDDVSFERAWHELNLIPGRAAASTIEALMLGLREGGVAALKERKVLERLAHLDKQQTAEVVGRLQGLKPEIARAWADDEISALMTTKKGL